MAVNSPTYRKIGFGTTVILLLLIPGTLFQVWLSAQELHLPYTIYTVEDGMPHNRVMHVGKDSRGFIWTSHGNASICRFDGKKFHEYELGECPWGDMGGLGDFLVETDKNLYF